MAPLSVAVDATPLLGPRTGVGNFVRGLLTALTALPGAGGDELALTGYGLTWTGRQALPAALPAGVAAARGLPMPAGPLLRLWAHADLAPAEWWTGPVDVVHGTNFVVPPCRRAAPVVTVHDLTCVHYPELCAPASLRFPALVRRAVARGAWVHTHTDYVAAEVVEAFGVDADRVRAVPAGLDPVTEPLAPDRAPEAPTDGEPYVLALSSVEPRKDLPTLVRAFDIVAAAEPDVRLVVAGPDAWGTPELDAALERSAYRIRIERTGWVSDGRRTELLRRATVLAYPSIYEGFGLPPLEAMALGVPVVTTMAGSIPEVVGDGARLVPPRDPEALAEALLAVLTDRPARLALIGRGRARAAAFTWSRCADGLLDLYRLAGRR